MGWEAGVVPSGLGRARGGGGGYGGMCGPASVSTPSRMAEVGRVISVAACRHATQTRALQPVASPLCMCVRPKPIQ